ncbi:MAG: hypothetical protein ABIV39_14090 [Verrucomicrobiota bacterium]
MHDSRIILILVGSVLLLFLSWSAITYFSPEARLERRRRKNNSKVVNRASRPMVKLSAETGKKDPKSQ